MTVLKSFQASNAWDQRFNLPLVPMHNNPWIYLAYALKMIRLGKHTNDELIELVDLIEDHLARCRTKVWGEFYRWPEGLGGDTSHDEVMGIAYIDWCLKLETAPTKAILERLLETDGVYNVQNVPEKIPEEHNIYRFVWMEAFLKACTNKFRVGFISQFWFSVALLKDIFKYKKEDGNESGLLLKWIMFEPMEKYLLSGITIGFWKSKMKKLGINPKQIFTEKYLKECPAYGENAPNEF